MGVAAYNRGSSLISRQISDGQPTAESILIRDLNSLPRVDKAPKPFGPVHFTSGHGGWWAECPTNGSGFWYPTLCQAVTSFQVTVIGYEDGKFVAQAGWN